MRVRATAHVGPVPSSDIAPYLNWLYRWPFISPMLSASRNYLTLEQRVRAESAIDTVADLLVSSEPIETPVCLASQAMHLTYLICLLAAGQSLECCLYENKQKNTMSIGAYHYHARQALMGWDSAFLTIFQNLADIRELLCSPPPPELADSLIRGDVLRTTCECQMQCAHWHVISEVLEHMFHSRITIYEMEYVARACGFSLEDLEEDLVVNDLLMSPISFAVLLDDISLLQKIEQAVKESDLPRTVECLGTVAAYLSDDPRLSVDVFSIAAVMLPIGRMPTKLTQWFAFGGADMVDTCVNDIPVKPFVENMERWDSMKRDLKNVTEAMVGILPPEDVVNRFTSFLDSKNNRKKKNFRSNSTATTT